MRGLERACARTAVRRGKKAETFEYCAHFSEGEVKMHRTALREGKPFGREQIERDSREPGTAPFFIARKGGKHEESDNQKYG